MRARNSASVAASSRDPMERISGRGVALRLPGAAGEAGFGAGEGVRR